MKKFMRNLAVVLLAQAGDTSADVAEVQLLMMQAYAAGAVRRIRALGGRGSGQ